MNGESTLTYFGTVFQSKIISSLLSDQKFLQTISDILNPVYFDSDANGWLVGTIISYFYKYKTIPTLEVLKVKIDEMDNDILQVSVVKNLKESWRNMESTDLQFVKEETIQFCKNQVIKNAIMQSVDLLEGGKYEEIKKMIDEAMKAGADRDLGHVYIEGIEERLTKSTRETISTGWDPIDEIMDGGLGAGELGVIVAPSGIGKTWCLQSIGSYGVKRGLSVIHYTLELNQEYVGVRYDTIFSGTPTANIKYYKDEVKKIVESLKGNLLIKYFPTKSASVQTLSSHLNQIELQGIKPDLVLVDYADLLSGVGREKRFILENVYEDLRGFAGEYELPVWTACFHGDTIISSPNGKFKIKDMVGKSGFPVFSYNHKKSKMVCKTVKSVYKSGDGKELWKVTLDNDKEIIVTPNHKFMLRTGEYRELRYLKVGESLMPFNRKMKDNRKQIYLNNGSWQPQYRMVGEWKYGEIPKYYQIHHKDMNKYNDHSDNLELLTISEHYKIHGRKSWDKNNSCGISHLREVYSERMKLNNPMNNKETRIKVGKSRSGKCKGDDNPMRLTENQKKLSESLKNSIKFSEYKKTVPQKMKSVWRNRTTDEKNEIFNKANDKRKATYDDKKKRSIKLYTDGMNWFDFRDIILNEMKYNEDNLYGLYKKLSGIKISRKEYKKLYNHKIKSIEFYGYDDVYNMEVEDLHNYALDAGVVVKNSQANRCHVLTDKVETENGKIEIGKIKEGDEILTHNGYKKITRVFPVEKQPVYKVKLKSGKEITISANHDLPVMYGKLKSVVTGLKVGDKLFTKKVDKK